VRRAMLSVAGVNAQGYYNSNLLLVGTEKAMMNAADEVVVLADSTKFGRSSLAHICPLGDVDVLVVDDEISDEWRRRLEDAGVTIVVARADEGNGSAPADGQAGSSAT
ncbi:MAG: DeoR/GlpR transcriptional regulator, partial [Pirellulaceae bacterium]